MWHRLYAPLTGVRQCLGTAVRQTCCPILFMFGVNGMDYTQEVWKDVVGFESSHMISSHGRVLTKGRYIKNNGALVWQPEHLRQSYVTTTGYMQIGLNVDGKQYKKYIHRLVAEAFLDNPLSLPEVDHIDRNRANNHLGNLRWVDHKENMKGASHSKRKQRTVVRRQRVSAKPSKKELRSVISEQHGNFTAVGRMYSVTDNAVRKWCKSYGLESHSRAYQMGA